MSRDGRRLSLRQSAVIADFSFWKRKFLMVQGNFVRLLMSYPIRGPLLEARRKSL